MAHAQRIVAWAGDLAISPFATSANAGYGNARHRGRLTQFEEPAR